MAIRWKCCVFLCRIRVSITSCSVIHSNPISCMYCPSVISKVLLSISTLTYIASSGITLWVWWQKNVLSFALVNEWHSKKNVAGVYLSEGGRVVPFCSGYLYEVKSGMAPFDHANDFSIDLFVVKILDDELKLLRNRVVVVCVSFDLYNALKPFHLEFGRLLVTFAEVSFMRRGALLRPSMGWMILQRQSACQCFH